MIALRGDAVEVFHQRVGQLLHFWKSLPPQGLEPPEQESGDAHAGLIRPEMIEFLSEHLRLEQPMIRAKDGAQFLAFRHAHHLPPPEQQPALAAAEPTHHWACAERIPSAETSSSAAAACCSTWNLSRTMVAVGKTRLTAFR